MSNLIRARLTPAFGKMNSATDSSTAKKVALKQRLSALTAAQRAQLARQLASDSPSSDSLGERPAIIPRAEPLRVEAETAEADAARTVAIYPAGQGQLQMWFLQYYAPESPVYNIPQAFHLFGKLAVENLEAAFRIVIRRHDSLRTTFAMEGGHLVQRVASSSPFQLQHVDLENLRAGERTAAAHQSVEELACRPFDLVTEAQIRARLVRLHAEEHVLVVVVHHIISDGWSQSNLFREISTLYAAAAAGGEPSLPASPLQFADFSVWQEKRLRDSALLGQTAYWKTKLTGTAQSLDLATDRPRANVSSFRGESFLVPIEPELWAALQALAQREGATVFIVLLAAFKILLHRHTGQEDVRAGVPIANRQQVETEGLIGFFVNTLVMRTSLSGDLTFREVLGRVRATAVEAYANSDLSFERLVSLFTDQPAADRAPLLQTLFSLQDFPETTVAFPGLEARPWPVNTHTSKMDFSVAVKRDGPGWAASVEYDTDLFEAARLEEMVAHWLTILKSVVIAPAQRICEIPLLAPAERERLLVGWNQTARDYPRDQCVHHLFEVQARATPEAVSLVMGGECLTYRELHEKSDRVAGHLRAFGVERGALVGLSVERSFEMVIGMLGILKAGGAYWAVEENLPDERVRLLLADAQPRVLLARRSAVDRLTALMNQAPADGRISAIEDLLRAPCPATVGCSADSQADDPVYVSYTSGSTGRPKGVLIPHRGVVRLVKNVDYASLTPAETFLHMAPLSFDASTFELWGALLNGARVILMPPGQASLSEIGEAIRQHGVTTLWLTAGLFHLMVEQRVDDLKPLRQLLAGGDVLTPEDVLKARRALPGCRIINGYGPTENTTFTCCFTVAKPDDLIQSVPIGHPIANTQVYVLDPSCQPVPVGVAGELYAGGDGVALGYLNQPELTAERFIPDPFSSRAGARLYRTGDRVRWRSDGNLEFIGRLDSEVKIRGYRVELGEIETVLRGFPGVRDAAVVRRDALTADRVLVGYVVSNNGAISTEDLRAHLRDRLPDYMVPSALMVLEDLPLSPNGKVDRRALPAPALPSGNAPEGSRPPATLLEMELIRLWQRLFQREDIGREDNFFALGGHSLLAALMTAEIDKLLGCKLPIAALFQSPTIESLALRLTEENWAPPWSSLVPLQPNGARPPLFFTHGAGGDVYGFVWLVKLLAPDQPSYGLQAVGSDGQTPRHTTVEEMAAHYVQEIRSLQPKGPYHLAGFSMGGLIAFEIAQQLYRLGERVALLAVIDTAPMSAPWTVYGRTLAPYFWQRSKFHLARWRKMPRRHRLGYLLRCWSGLRWWAAGNSPKPRVVTAAPEKGTELPEVPGFYDYYWAVASAYKLRRYPGTIDLFLSDSANPKFTTFWGHLARGGAILHRVPGKHLELVAPDRMPMLAKALGTALERAQRNGDSSANGQKLHVSPFAHGAN